MKKIYGIIYKITNLINGKIRIGQTTRSLDERVREYVNDKRCIMYNVIKKYGIDNLKFETIDECYDIDELNYKEDYWITKCDCLTPNGYNIRLGGGSQGKLGENTKHKISLAMKGRKFEQSTIEKMRLANTGKKLLKETIDKIRNANLNYKPEHKKYKGVYISKNPNYKYRVYLDGKTICHCRTEVEAAYYYNLAVDEYRGGIGYKNIINEYELYKEINTTRDLCSHGVIWSKQKNKWQALTKIDGKCKHIGYFKSKLDAKIAYNDFIIRNNLDKPLNWTDGKWLI